MAVDSGISSQVKFWPPYWIMFPDSPRCMIKIFQGGRGGDTFKTPSPLRITFAFTHPCFKMFLERSLNDPPPPHFKHLSLLPAHPIPPKNFDHTQGVCLLSLAFIKLCLAERYLICFISRSSEYVIILCFFSLAFKVY